jgi:hypothetical protein
MGKARSSAGARSVLLVLAVALFAALGVGLLLSGSGPGSRGLAAGPRVTLAVPGSARVGKTVAATGTVAGGGPGGKVLLERRSGGAWRALARGAVRAHRFRVAFRAPASGATLVVRVALLEGGRRAAISPARSIRLGGATGEERGATSTGAPAPSLAAPTTGAAGAPSPPATETPAGTGEPETPTEPPAEEPEPPIEEPPAPGPSYWGAWIGSQLTGTEAPFDMNAVSAFEAQAEKPLSLINFSSPFAACPEADAPLSSCTFSAFPRTQMEAVRGHGAIPFFSWASDSTPVSTSEPEFQFADVIEGKFDSYIRGFAREAAAWGHPFFLRFNWEMNGNWFPWTERTNGNEAGEYVEAWRHVHDLFEEEGATDATWVWCPYVDPNATLQSPLASLYPGDEYVDWTCLDGYNWGPSATPPRHWRSFSYLFGPTYRQITESIAPSKPMLVGETASSEVGENESQTKAGWIHNLFAALPTEFPRIQGLLWFDKDEDMDWPIETSEAARKAFAAGIADPRYRADEFAGLTTSPIPTP